MSKFAAGGMAGDSLYIADGNTVFVTTVNEIGSFDMKKMTCLEVIEKAKTVLEALKA